MSTETIPLPSVSDLHAPSELDMLMELFQSMRTPINNGNRTNSNHPHEHHTTANVTAAANDLPAASPSTNPNSHWNSFICDLLITVCTNLNTYELLTLRHVSRHWSEFSRNVRSWSHAEYCHSSDLNLLPSALGRLPYVRSWCTPRTAFMPLPARHIPRPSTLILTPTYIRHLTLGSYVAWPYGSEWDDRLEIIESYTASNSQVDVEFEFATRMARTLRSFQLRSAFTLRRSGTLSTATVASFIRLEVLEIALGGSIDFNSNGLNSPHPLHPITELPLLRILALNCDGSLIYARKLLLEKSPLAGQLEYLAIRAMDDAGDSLVLLRSITQHFTNLFGFELTGRFHSGEPAALRPVTTTEWQEQNLPNHAMMYLLTAPEVFRKKLLYLNVDGEREGAMPQIAARYPHLIHWEGARTFTSLAFGAAHAFQFAFHSRVPHYAKIESEPTDRPRGLITHAELAIRDDSLYHFLRLLKERGSVPLSESERDRPLNRFPIGLSDRLQALSSRNSLGTRDLLFAPLVDIVVENNYRGVPVQVKVCYQSVTCLPHLEYTSFEEIRIQDQKVR
jgi:hypothetical protein